MLGNSSSSAKHALCYETSLGISKTLILELNLRFWYNEVYDRMQALQQLECLRYSSARLRQYISSCVTSFCARVASFSLGFGLLRPFWCWEESHFWCLTSFLSVSPSRFVETQRSGKIGGHVGERLKKWQEKRGTPRLRTSRRGQTETNLRQSH